MVDINEIFRELGRMMVDHDVQGDAMGQSTRMCVCLLVCVLVFKKTQGVSTLLPMTYVTCRALWILFAV